MPMISVLVALFLSLRSCLRSRVVLQLEILALRHQLQVLNRSRPRRLQLVPADLALGVAVAIVDRLANRARHRPAGHRHRLASSGLPPVLDLEESPPRRPTRSRGRRPRIDSDHV